MTILTILTILKKKNEKRKMKKTSPQIRKINVLMCWCADELMIGFH
jgi:hypothetical protein